MKRFVLLMFRIVLMMGLILVANSCSKEDLLEDEGLAIGLKSAPVTASASGHGWYDMGDGQKRQFSFHAKVMPDGTVKGSGVISYTSGELLSSFDITSMVVEDNTARLAGILTKSPVYEGSGCYFYVEDNGEGKKPGTVNPDVLTTLFVGLPLPADCDDYFADFGLPPALSFDGGNIQVNP
jgi:hypothetical protein